MESANRESLVDALLAAAAAAAGVSPDDLIAASDLDRTTRSLRMARTTRLMTMRAAADQRITVAELRSLIRAAGLFGND